MNFKSFFAAAFIINITTLFSQNQLLKADSLSTADGSHVIINLDSLFDDRFHYNVLSGIPAVESTNKTINQEFMSVKLSEAIGNHAFDSLLNENQQLQDFTPTEFTFSKNTPLINIDTLILKANPFFIELVYLGLSYKFEFNTVPDFQTLYYGAKTKNLTTECVHLPDAQAPEFFIYTLRHLGRDEITRTAAHLYVFTFDQLPDPNRVRSHFITKNRLDRVKFVDNDESNSTDKKLTLKKIIVSPWIHNASALAQFTQNSVSSNWYQGGTSNLAVLGILSGKLNYDNKKSIQWENAAEWRMGFNTVSGDTLRSLSTNDDILKISSKLGIKAGGNWFYSGSIDFSTQFFNSYKGVNSAVMKASFLTPVRLNIGFGFDYKYKKTLSLMFSPVAYKYIYIDDKVNVDPNLFGIEKNENVLSEIGSSFKAIQTFPITREINVDSKFSFYTNYKKVEIDWEIVCNMAINRFMSTRLSLNPRYDNTVIEKNGDVAGIQYKQLLSVGFSHKFK